MTAGRAREDSLSFTGVTWGEGGWNVESCEGFTISTCGDLTLDADWSILIECLSDMNKGGGEFSLFNKGSVPVELIVVGIDLYWVCDIVNDGVSESKGSWLLVVVVGRGGHAWSLSK